MTVDRPPILVADLDAPNALSLGGPRKGVIVLDDDLLGLLSIDELEGIIAHELAHIESYDTFVQTTIVTGMRTLVGLLFFLSLPVVLVLLGVDRGAAWIAGQPGEWRYGVAWLFGWALQVLVSALLSPVTLGVLAYSRRREYAADSRAVEVTENPVALARALTKIHRAANPRGGVFSLLYIQHERDSDARRLLSTHPPIPERVERLVGRADGVAGHGVELL
jgi:heat shock protein HtpX